MQENSTCLSIYFDRPSHDGMCNRNFVNVAPLQLGEEVFWIPLRALTKRSSRHHSALMRVA
jgi:hypothetical protein